MPKGRLTARTRKFKRQYVIIEEIAMRFEPGVVYAEYEVNAMLESIYPIDRCTLRRYLVELRFVQRKNSLYWP